MGSSKEDYEVHNLLGRGGFASVYRAISRRTKQEVAIKMMERTLIVERGYLHRVREEVELHSRLKHPSILEVYDYFEDENYVYLVTELCPKGEMQGYLRKHGPLSEDDARKYMKQIVEGIIYLHSHNILHRDLSLSNLLLTQDMKVKIGDFGLATKLNSPDDKHLTMCGTPNYIPPEVASRVPHGLAADLWSVGVMLYTFLTGKPPFDSEDARNTINRVKDGTYVLPQHLSPEACNLIQKLLRKNPEERLSPHQVLCHPFITKSPLPGYQRITHKVSEMSLDSGQGTMATVMSNRSSASSKSRALSGFPLHDKQPQILEVEETPHNPSSRGHPHGSHQGGRGGLVQVVFAKTSGPGPPASQFPMSPPVRERDSLVEAERWRAKYNLQSPEASHHAYSHVPTPTRTTEAGGGGWQAGGGEPGRVGGDVPVAAPGFDPRRYQDVSHSSSSWSGSFYSQGRMQQASPSAGIHGLSAGNSEASTSSEFSLTATRKVLSYDTDSGPTSMHEKFQGSQGHPRVQQQGLAQTVEDQLSRIPHLPQPVEYPAHDPTHKVYLSNKAVRRGLKSGSMENLLSPRSESSGEGGEKQGSGGEGCIQALVAPLNALRLRPIRQKTKNAVVNILEGGDVCLEFLKQKKGDDRVVEIFNISADGQQITLFHPGESGGLVVTDHPPAPPPGSLKSYTYATLPEKYWKKYQYAARFVNLVRSKTPKVTMYTSRAKCMLMENGPNTDFETVFYDGAKVTCSHSGVKIIERNGTSLTLDSLHTEHQRLSAETKELLDFVKQCRGQCLELEAVISSVQSSSSSSREHLFPVIVGRRPNSSLDGSKSSSATTDTHSSEGHNSTKVPSSSNPMMASFDGTVLSHMTVGSQVHRPAEPYNFTLSSHPALASQLPLTSKAPMTPQVASTSQVNVTSHTQAASQSSSEGSGDQTGANEILRQAFVPNIGWASQHVNGDIWVKFNDGTQLGVKSKVSTVIHIDQMGSVRRFQQADSLPELVRGKLELVPSILQCLRAKASSQVSTSSHPVHR